MPRLASLTTGRLYIKCLTNPSKCDPKKAKTPSMTMCFTEIGCIRLKKAPPTASLLRQIRKEAKKKMVSWLVRYLKFTTVKLPLVQAATPYVQSMKKNVAKKLLAQAKDKAERARLKEKIMMPLKITTKKMSVEYVTAFRKSNITAFLKTPFQHAPFDEIAKHTTPKRLKLSKIAKGMTRRTDPKAGHAIRQAVAGPSIERSTKAKMSAEAHTKSSRENEKSAKAEMKRDAAQEKVMKKKGFKHISHELLIKGKMHRKRSAELMKKVVAAKKVGDEKRAKLKKVKEMKLKADIKSGKKKVVKVVEVKTEFALTIPISKKDFAKKQKGIEADMAKNLKVHKKDVKSVLVTAKKNLASSLLEVKGGKGNTVKFEVIERRTIDPLKPTPPQAKKKVMKLTDRLKKVQSGKVKLGGVKLPKQKIKPKVHKPRTRTIVKKVPLQDQPVKDCVGKGQAPKTNPKPVRKSQVARALKVDKALGKNILALKAYSLAAHDFLADKLLDQQSKLSALGAFIYQFGSSAMVKSNTAGEYLALEAQFREFYCIGIGKYLMKQLNDAMRKKSGVLMFGKAKGKNVVMLNFKRIGLASGANFIKQWAVSSLQFNKYSTQTLADSKSLSNSEKFRKDGCKCMDVGKWSTCKKWFAYDKAAWCIVNDGCKGAFKNPRLGFWKYCA